MLKVNGSRGTFLNFHGAYIGLIGFLDSVFFCDPCPHALSPRVINTAAVTDLDGQQRTEKGSKPASNSCRSEM